MSNQYLIIITITMIIAQVLTGFLAYQATKAFYTSYYQTKLKNFIEVFNLRLDKCNDSNNRYHIIVLKNDYIKWFKINDVRLEWEKLVGLKVNR